MHIEMVFLLTICSQAELEDSEVPLILVTESEKLDQAKRKIQFISL